MEVRLESSTGPQVVAPSQSIDHFANQTRLRVVVQIDGGRIRPRENRKRPPKQRRRKGQREKFDTPW